MRCDMIVTTSKTIRWAPGAPAVTIAGKWRRLPDGSVMADYDPDELRLVLEVAQVLDLSQLVGQFTRLQNASL